MNKQGMYPMVQDGMSYEQFLYTSALDVIRRHCLRVVSTGDISRETILAQVDKDLRFMLDQKEKVS